MANSGFFTMTGTGRQAISPTGYIKEVAGKITVQGTGTFLNTTSPRRAMHFGWYALGYHAITMDGSTVEQPTHWRFIELDVWDFIFPASSVFGDSVWYRMNPGVTARMCIFW